MALTQRKRSFGSAEIWNLFREAGYVKPTHLQQRLIPLILRGRDVAVEAEADSGKTVAFILPLMVKLKRGKAGIKAIVLTSTTDNSLKVYREFRRFIRSGKSLSVFALGLEDQERKEHRILAKHPDVVIGIPSKIIDHIRRGNLHFPNLQVAVIDRAEAVESPGFVEDVRFIFSKFPQKKQTILICSTLAGDNEQLIPLLRHPYTVPMSSWRQLNCPVENIFIDTAGNNRLEAAIKLILAEPMETLLIQSASADNVRAIAKRIKDHHLDAACLLGSLTVAQQNKVCQTFSVGRVPILVGTFEEVGKRNLRWVTHVINLDPPPDPDSYKPRSFVLQKVITLGSGDQQNRLKEKLDMHVEKQELPGEEKVLQGAIQQILKRIREEEEPNTLNRYRSIIRRNVPFTLRSYFAAYLFKSSFTPETKKRLKFVKLFLSMGKNRKVFPKDLIQLFMQRLQLGRAQIGEIKVLDNYSFVEIDQNLAERAIRELSGLQFKGRSLAVNYARTREQKHQNR
jgi:ATP-dependent RNA helicase DeaD